jgi:hypothetical protein
MFKGAEKPFSRGIILIIDFSAHALSHFHDRQLLSVFMVGSLAAPIRMMAQARLGFFAPKGHL